MGILPSALRPFPSLAELADEHLVALSKSLNEATYRAGAQICREGDAGDSCYFLLSGKVEVSKGLPDGRRVFLAELHPGTIFGQGGLVPNQVRSADVRAATNVRVLCLRKIDHSWGLEKAEPWAIHIQELICIHVVRQLREALTRLGGLAGADQATSKPTTRAKPAPQTATSSLVGTNNSEARAVRLAQDRPGPGGEDPLPAPPLQSHDASTTGRLLTLLAETEASLADGGINLSDVQFVVDADAARRVHNRKP